MLGLLSYLEDMDFCRKMSNSLYFSYSMAKTAGSNESSASQASRHTPPEANSAAAPASYEAALAELEALVGRMEGGALSLEESLGAYRRGATLVAFCQQQLEKVEQQVRVLDGDTLKPLPEEFVDDIGGA
jgi:exodeoxyribonuclease VII small subunit